MTLERVQMLLEPEQRKILGQIARRQGKSVSEITRRAITAGLRIIQQEDLVTRRKKALEKAKKLRDSMPLLEINVIEDIQKIREERVGELFNRN